MAKRPKETPKWLADQRARQAEFRAVLAKRVERDRELANAARRDDR